MKTQDLRTCLRKDPVSLDPGKGNDMVASQVHFMMYEGLYRLNADMTLSAAQAKSCEISADRKTYTFQMAKGKWSDGSPVTAHDFEKSWKRLLDPAFPCPDTYLLYCIKGAKGAKKGECPLSEVRIQAIDPQTLVVELEHPTPYFLQIVSSSVLLPVHAQSHICNGPFKLAKWDFNNQIILDKNPHYRLANKVRLDHIYLEILDREMAALHMYASGHFDLIGAPLSFFPAILSHDLEQRDLVTAYPVASTKFLSFNTEVEPFTNTHIRQAFSLAIDRHAIAKNITRLNEKEAFSLIPPALFSLHERGEEKEATKCLAKGLKELKKKAVGPISFMYCSSEINHLLAQELQHKWATLLGAQVTLEAVDFKTLHERSQKGDFAIGLFALLADYADPMNILERFEDPSNHRNYSKWHNDRYCQLLQEALAASDEAQYQQCVQRAEALLAHEMPVAPLYHENYLFLVHPHVKGFEISPLGHIFFDRVSLE